MIADTTWRGWLAAVCTMLHPSHNEDLTMTDTQPRTLTAERRRELGDIVIDVGEDLIEDGKLTEDELLDGAEALADWLFDLPDGVWRWVIERAARATRRDPAKMRARADRVEARGNLKRAAIIRRRADEVEARQG